MDHDPLTLRLIGAVIMLLRTFRPPRDYEDSTPLRSPEQPIVLLSPDKLREMVPPDIQAAMNEHFEYFVATTDASLDGCEPDATVRDHAARTIVADAMTIAGSALVQGHISRASVMYFLEIQVGKQTIQVMKSGSVTVWLVLRTPFG